MTGPEPDREEAYAEFDELLAEVHDTAETELARREHRPDNTSVDSLGFIAEWPGLAGRLIEELR